MSGEFDWYIWIVHLLGDLFSKHIRVVWTVWIEEGTVWGYIYHIHLVFWNSGFSSYTGMYIVELYVMICSIVVADPIENHRTIFL